MSNLAVVYSGHEGKALKHLSCPSVVENKALEPAVFRHHLLGEPKRLLHLAIPNGVGKGREGASNQTDIDDTTSWWTFRIFFIFFLLGEGESGAPGGGGGGRFLIENPRRGVSRRGRGRGAGRVSAANCGIARGGGAIYFFSGPKCPPRH